MSGGGGLLPSCKETFHKTVTTYFPSTHSQQNIYLMWSHDMIPSVTGDLAVIQVIGEAGAGWSVAHALEDVGALL